MEIIGILVTTLTIFLTNFFNQKIISPFVHKTQNFPSPTLYPVSISVTPGFTPTPSPLSTGRSSSQKLPTPTPDTDPWGVAKKVADHTYTMKIENEDRMSTPQELLKALNDYRIKKGSQVLNWEERLCPLADDRAKFQSQNGLDAHQGFIDYLENQDGFKKTGFGWLGENASQGYVMSGQHLVEFIFASDQEHDQNQLANHWDRSCVAIVNTTVEIIFATSPL